jgi:hypothetical protein
VKNDRRLVGVLLLQGGWSLSLGMEISS